MIQKALFQLEETKCLKEEYIASFKNSLAFDLCKKISGQPVISVKEVFTCFECQKHQKLGRANERSLRDLAFLARHLILRLNSSPAMFKLSSSSPEKLSTRMNWACPFHPILSHTHSACLFGGDAKELTRKWEPEHLRPFPRCQYKPWPTLRV